MAIPAGLIPRTSPAVLHTHVWGMQGHVPCTAARDDDMWPRKRIRE